MSLRPAGWKGGHERIAAERHEPVTAADCTCGICSIPLHDTIRKREARLQWSAHRLDVEARHDAVIEIEAEIEADDPHLAAQAQRRDDESVSESATCPTMNALRGGMAPGSPVLPLRSPARRFIRVDRRAGMTPHNKRGQHHEPQSRREQPPVWCEHALYATHRAEEIALAQDVGQPDAGRRTKQRQQESFRQERLDHPPTAGAERRAHGQLVLTRYRAREQQSGHVDRADQQHEAEQHEQQDGKQAEPDRRAAELHRIGGKTAARAATSVRSSAGTGVSRSAPIAVTAACARSRVCPGANRASTLNVWLPRSFRVGSVSALTGTYAFGVMKPVTDRLVLGQHTCNGEDLAVEDHGLADRVSDLRQSGRASMDGRERSFVVRVRAPRLRQ
jgi:hypothetical protein